MNRSKQNCGNCSAYRQMEGGNAQVGMCCANPPILVQSVRQSVVRAGPEAVAQGMFPPTAPTMWCRQWQDAMDFDDVLARKEN